MYKFASGQKLIIELNYGAIIEGEFVSSSQTRLDINNWKHSATSTEINPSIEHLYQSEIVNVTAFEYANESVETTSSHKEEEKQQAQQQQPVAGNYIKIPERKYNELKELSKSYIYMAVMDARYHSATYDLLNSETAAVAMLSTDYGRGAPLEILVASTWSQIYIFDISLYNCKRFPKELKFFLESDDIVKVMHDSRGLTDCLYHRYKIRLNNVFDTYVAGLMLSNEKLTLPESLKYFFNIPENLIKYSLSAEVKTQWKERPLSDVFKEHAAKHVQFLITLKNYLQKELMKEFHEKVLEYSHSTLEQSHLDAQISLGCLDINKS